MRESDTGSAGTEAQARALRELRPAARDVPILLLVAAILLLAGQLLPGVTIHFIVREPEHYSVVGGALDLWNFGNHALAVVLFCFSVLFPTVKLLGLVWLWFKPMDGRRRAIWCHRLKALGKWSMLDTFVVILLIGTIQLSRLLVVVRTYAEPAVYLFAAAIILSIALTFRIAKLAQTGDENEHIIPPLDWSVTFASWSAAGCLVASLIFPVLRVEKKGITHIYSILEGTRELALDGMGMLLAAMVGLFVIGLPLVYLVGLGGLALRKSPSERSVSRLVALERWAMADVFVLALWLVYTKVSGIADAARLPGFWLMIAAGTLSVYCAYRVRRVY